MTIFFQSNHFNTIIYTKQCCVPCFVQNKPCLNHFIRQSVKNAKKKPQKRNLAINFKHITIYFDSKNFKTITYKKQCCAPSFVPNKTSLHHFMRENAKNAKQPQKRNLVCNLKHMSIVFNSSHFNTITNNKLYCVPSFVPNKPSLNHFMRESAKKALKNFKNITLQVVSII